MKLKVIDKQFNCPDCFVCGTKNPFGLNTRFYILEDDILVGITTGKFEHNSYPRRMHGGIISALLDETIGRAIQNKDKQQFGVTVDLHIKYMKPTPLEEKLYIFGKITNQNRFTFKGIGYLVSESGVVCARGDAVYFKLNQEQITQEDYEWYQVEGEDDPLDVEIPDEVYEKLLKGE